MTLLGLLSLAARPGEAQPSANAPQPPPRHFDIRRFGELTSLSPTDRTREGLEFVREEIANPSAALSSMVPDDVIDHGDTLARMALLLAEKELDVPLLRSEFQKSAPGEFLDVLGLLLGLEGER